jgi:2-polyprenyl-3-methyl-5-hydroxy-6-metoxy-1,4-benzoquinol methylase
MSKLPGLLSLLKANPLAARARNTDVISLNIKNFGYQLACDLAAALPVREGLSPSHVGLQSKPSTQADIASDWVAYWCSELKIPVVFHRKIWELAYVLQAIYEHGSIRPGARGLGFGCGTEALPSYLGQRGVQVTVTDQAPEAMKAQGWARTNQHTTSIEQAFKPQLISRDVFDRNVSLRYVDMNAIDSDLKDYDFCWSICAFEHLGSIQKGLDFVVNSLNTIRPGGLSVHTTEFNFANDKKTIDNRRTVLFQRKHFLDLERRLRVEGHGVAPLSFNVGDLPLDKFIDLPPFVDSWSSDLKESWGCGSYHIKVSVDGFPATCFGIIVTRASEHGTVTSVA